MKFGPRFFSALTAGFLLAAAPIAAQSQTLVATSFGQPDVDEQAVAVRQLPDGRIFLGGTSSLGQIGGADFTLSLISPEGDSLLWTKYLGTPDSDFCHYMNNGFANGLVMVGSTYSGATGSIPNGIILHADVQGNIVFQDIYGQPNTAESFNFVEQTTDGGFIVCGFVSNTQPNGVGNDAVVVKYDAVGTVQWQTILGGYDNDYAQEIHQTSDGGYIVGVDSKSYNLFGFYDCIAYKLNAAGEEVWRTIAGNDTVDTGNQGIVLTAAGDYILFGEAGSALGQGFDLTISKVHRNGQLLWDKKIPAAGTEAAFSAIELPNQNLLLTGYSNANSAGNAPTDAFILELDSAGTPLHYSYAGGPENEITYDVQHSPFGGQLICGSTQKSGSFDYYLLLYNYPGPVAAPSVLQENYAAMHVFPNPAAPAQTIGINLPAGDYSITLHDQLGNVCWRGTLQKHQTTLTLPPGLQAGIYVLQAANAHLKATQKVVISAR